MLSCQFSSRSVRANCAELLRLACMMIRMIMFSRSATESLTTQDIIMLAIGDSAQVAKFITLTQHHAAVRLERHAVIGT